MAIASVDKLNTEKHSLWIAIMATGPFTDGSSSLEYDAEVAYVVATSLREHKHSQSSEDDEFDFLQRERRLSTIENGRANGILSQARETVDGTTDQDLDTEAVGSASGGQLVDSLGTPIVMKRDHVVTNTSNKAGEESPKSKLFTETQYKTLVIYGPSGWGKTHLVHKLAGSYPSVFSLAISHTTRKKREGEIDGIHFHFVSYETMSSEIAQGNFIEHVQISRAKGNQKSTREALATGGKFESLFDLTEEDSTTVRGELFGTSRHAFQQAIQQGKPCVLLNVSSKGASQLKKAGVEGSYILLCPGKSSEPLENEELQANYTISTDHLENAFSELNQYAFQAIQELNLPHSTKYQLTRQEWDSIPTVEIERGGLAQHPDQKLVTFSELLSHFQNANLSKQKAEAKVERHKSGIAHFFSRSKLAKRLHYERLLVFAISLCPLNDREPLHLRTLQTIYRKLTGSILNVRRFGTHWQEIGFQQADPADDLRGVGFLGLMQLVYFMENTKTLPLAREIYNFTRDGAHSVPFCVLSFNFTRITLSALREGYLSKICNKRDQVLVVVNEFHTAMFYRYYQIWKSRQVTDLEVGPLIQEVGEFSKKNAKQVLAELSSLLASKEQHSLPPLLYRHQQSPNNPFTPFDQIRDSVLIPD